MFSSWKVILFLDLFNPNYISLKIKTNEIFTFLYFLLALVKRTISDKLKFYFLTSSLDSRCLSINLYNIETNFYFFFYQTCKTDKNMAPNCTCEKR